MATLSKHGRYTIIEYANFNRALCEDGNILINRGEGWKLWKRLKAGRKYDEVVKTFGKSRTPAYDELLNLLKDVTGSLKRRATLVNLIQLLDDDFDGIWVHYNDTYPEDTITCDEISQVYEAYQRVLKEKN